tara:strand:+ start:710 stop:1636 length:927 start_codon:yes stop_codon:yes gene_type:complete
MKSFLKNIFSSLISKENDRTIFSIGSAHFSKMKKNYPDIKSLIEVDYKVFSQNGEDGIIDYLLNSLNINVPKFLEIGVGNYKESNTRYLFEKSSCKGMIVDNIKNLKQKVSKYVKLWKGDLTIIENTVTSENILEILSSNNFDKNLDIFSLDIDGIDYWVMQEIPENISKIVVAEYNAIFGPNLEVSVPNIKNFDRKKYHYSYLCYGTSLRALINLMIKKKYVFLGTNIACNNAFFVSESEIKKININLPDIKDLEKFTRSNFTESRSVKGELNYLSGQDKLKEIENCEVIDLSTQNNNLVKLKNICQ